MCNGLFRQMHKPQPKPTETSSVRTVRMSLLHTESDFDYSVNTKSVTNSESDNAKSYIRKI